MAINVLVLYMYLTFVVIFGHTRSEDVTVQTASGQIVGFTSDITKGGQLYSVSQFLGIPFAEPPTGERRFAKPVKKGVFSSPFIAKVQGHACPSLYDPGNEDCLNLNIFVPGKPPLTQSRAVMVWIYGGGFQVGSQNDYLSPGFAGMNDVIYVTLNYRTNSLGFLANRNLGLKGNYGLWDQHMAIQWVHDNIAAFGGDTDRVTVFGESAGAASVIYQGLYPGNRGLFQNAIAQSGSSAAYWAFDEDPEKKFVEFVAGSNCTGSFSAIENCIRNINANSVLKVNGQTIFSPTVDGEFVRVAMHDLFNSKSIMTNTILKQFGDINLIIGINENDGTVLASEEMENGTTMAQMRNYVERDIAAMGHPANEIIYEWVIHEYLDRTRVDDPFSVGNDYFQLVKDNAMLVPMLITADAHLRANGTGRCYMYEYAHVSSFYYVFTLYDWMRGANHADEIPFVLGMPKTLFFTDVSDTFTLITEEERQLSMQMMSIWTRFAKTGSPNPTDKIVWPEYDSISQQYIVLKGNGSLFPVQQKMGLNAVNFWDNILPMLARTVQEAEKCASEPTSSASGFMLPLATCYFLIPILLCLF